MSRLKLVVTLVVAYAAFNAVAGISLVKAGQMRAQQHVAIVDAATK